MAKMSVQVSKMNVGLGTDKKEMYVSRVNRGTIYEIDDIAHQVALESGVNEHQFKAAVGTLVDAMITFLKAGNGVSLQDFATFLPEVKSDSSEDPEAVGVKRVRITMRAHKKLREALGDISYHIDNRYITRAEAPDDDDDTTTAPDTGGTDGDNGEGPSFD